MPAELINEDHFSRILKFSIMAEIYHIKIKKEYAAALIDDLIKIDAVENIEPGYTELPQWQKDALDKELRLIEESPGQTVAWDSIKSRFKPF